MTAGTITSFVGRCFGLGLPAQACPTFPHPPAPPMGGNAGSEFLELSVYYQKCGTNHYNCLITLITGYCVVLTSKYCSGVFVLLSKLFPSP